MEPVIRIGRREAPFRGEAKTPLPGRHFLTRPAAPSPLVEPRSPPGRKRSLPARARPEQFDKYR